MSGKAKPQHYLLILQGQRGKLDCFHVLHEIKKLEENIQTEMLFFNNSELISSAWIMLVLAAEGLT